MRVGIAQINPVLGDFQGNREKIQSWAKDAAARNFGFASYLEMFEAATPVRSSDERSLLLAATPTRQWVAWSGEDLAGAEVFESMESALAAVGGATTTGT